MRSTLPAPGYGMRSFRHADIRLAGSVQVAILRLALPPGISDREKKGTAENKDKGSCRDGRRDLRLPAHPGRPGARRRAGQRRASPPAHARDEPRVEPADAAPVVDRPGTRPGRSRTCWTVTSRRISLGRKWPETSPTYSPGRDGFTSRRSSTARPPKVAGWTMDDNYKTPLITSAINMVARTLDLPEGTVSHSDRGSNYTLAEFAGS